MPQYDDTIAALKAIIYESLKYPEKRKEFVAEGSVELIIGESELEINKITFDLFLLVFYPASLMLFDWIHFNV